jgi:hypothetical protein
VKHMNYTLFPTVEAMVAPEAMSALVSLPIATVSQQAIGSEYGRSGSRILRVTTNNGTGPCFILKRMSLAWDWLMRSTEDTLCRSVTLWQYGIFDQMPSEIAHGVLACAHDRSGWAVLMQDVGEWLVPFEPFTEAEFTFFLQAMAAFHAQFWQMEALKRPDLGLCQLHRIYQMFSPRIARVEIDKENNIPRRVIEGWELVQRELPADVIQILQALLDDPTPLCSALDQYPYTLVHGDWRHANQAYAPGTSKLYLLDWQLALTAQPAVELARFLITNSPLLPVSKEAAIEMYRQQLAIRLGAQFSLEWWEPQLALGLLGGFLQDGWAALLKATHWHVGEKHRAHWQADVPWWIKRVRAGIKWI